MDPELKKILRWEIENFSVRKDTITSDPFSSSGCKWCVTVYRKGYSGYMSLFLHDANTKLLRPGWKRRVKFCFLLLNQSGEELYRSADQGRCILLCAEVPGWGYRTKLTLTTLQEKGFLEKNKLTIQVHIQVVEVVHQGKSTENDLFDYGGVQIIASQVASVTKILNEHPRFSVRKGQGVKKAYLKKLLIGLIHTLIIKSPQSLSITELSNAQSGLTELTEAGFKPLDWLKSKFEELSLERKKALSDVQLLEERVKNVELALSDLNVELNKDKMIKSSVAGAKVPCFELIGFFIKTFFLSCFSISQH